MPDSCGQYNPEGCTESCQQCYEGVIAGVKEYACYGQCVVVDAYGHRHLGPGLGAPAGWTPSAGGSMAEMIADEIANINNSEPTPPTNFVDPLLSCNGDCGTLCGPFDNCYWRSDVLGNCIDSRCFSPKFPRPVATPPWRLKKKGRKVSPRDLTEVDRLTQTTVEEQKAALDTARLKFNSGTPRPVITPIELKYWPKQVPAEIYCNCDGKPGCGDKQNCGEKCWWMNKPKPPAGQADPRPTPGLPVPAGTVCECHAETQYPYTPEIETDNQSRKTERAALKTARNGANFDRTMQAAPDCCSGGPCGAGQMCYENSLTTPRKCSCYPFPLPPGIPPLGPAWKPFIKPPTTALTPMPTSLSCCSGGVSCVSPATCWRRIGITGVVECKCLSGNPNYPDSGGWTRFPRRAIGPIWA